MKIAQDMTRYDDFKYVLQDVGSLYLGAGFSYEELLAQELEIGRASCRERV